MDTPRQGITVLALSSAIWGMGAFFSLFLEQLEINGGRVSAGFSSPLLMGFLLLTVLIIIVTLLTRQARLQRESNRLLSEMLVAIGSLKVAAPLPPESGKFSPSNTPEIAPRLAAKRSPKLDMVIDWLAANPNTKLSNREIAKLLGVSHTIINQGQKAGIGN